METFEMLKKNLPPFFSAKKLLSGIKYPTFPFNLYVYKNLKYFLSKNLILHPKSVQNFFGYFFIYLFLNKNKSLFLVANLFRSSN